MANLLPPSVCERARILCRCHPERTVAELLGISRCTIWHLKKRGWQDARTTRPFRPMPSDFPIQSKHASRDELAAHYRASRSTVSRWRRELRGEAR